MKKIPICLIYTFFSALLVLNTVFSHAQVSASLVPKRGLEISFQSVPVIKGSGINFFDSARIRHVYNFGWIDQKQQILPDGTIHMFFGSRNTQASGTIDLKQNANQLTIILKCYWHDDLPGRADVEMARFWFPAFSNGKVLIDKQATVDYTLKAKTYNVSGQLEFVASLGNWDISVKQPMTFTDARKISSNVDDWSQNVLEYSLGDKNILLRKGDSLVREICIKFQYPFKQANSDIVVFNDPFLMKEPAYLKPENLNLPLIPQPRHLKLDSSKTCKITFVSNPPKNQSLELFTQLLKQRWRIPGFADIKINLREDNKLPAEGYFINISQNEVIIAYNSPQSLNYALQSLAWICYYKNEQLVLPSGIIEDSPATAWRGIHMFEGPEALDLHTKMYDKILFPLKMNKVVLQCEQAKWKSQPAIHSPIAVSLEDLKTEFDYLRKNGVEPIPLIQSLGHMEWFFINNQNLDLSLNPDLAYTIDPFNPKADKALTTLWQEAAELLKPSTIHVGLDEINMIGFKKNERKVLDLWEEQLPLLNQIARKYKARLMLWGDMGLAPTEGPDACNAENEAEALKFRKLIPRGTYIADWHYINNPKPDAYYKNLSIWSKEGFIPVASTWFNPENIYGFCHAAIQQQVGILQTTWAGFESCEKNMVNSINQFGAYVLALEYAWSGRKELPNQLPYDATQVWNTLFYQQPSFLSDKNTLLLSSNNGKPVRADFIDLLSADSSAQTKAIVFNFDPVEAEGIILEMEADNFLPEFELMAKVNIISEQTGKLENAIRYGRDVRCKTDKRLPLRTKQKENLTQFKWLFDAPQTISAINIEALTNYSGFKIHSIRVIEK